MNNHLNLRRPLITDHRIQFYRVNVHLGENCPNCGKTIEDLDLIALPLGRKSVMKDATYPTGTWTFRSLQEYEPELSELTVWTFAKYASALPEVLCVQIVPVRQETYLSIEEAIGLASNKPI